MKKTLSILILFSLISCKEIRPKPGGEKLETYINKKFNNMNAVGMQVAYMKNGKLSWQKSFGVKNIESQEPVEDNTLFMIASCSKPVTAAGVMLLVEQGRISLDEDINTYLPIKIVHPKFSQKPITTRMLLSHTSGLKDDWDVLDPLYTIESGGGDSQLQLSDYVKEYFLPQGKYFNSSKNFQESAPGEIWEYCNMGYALLGFIVEEVTKKPFEVFMRDDFFLPLGMNNTYWFLREIPHDNISRPHVVSKKDPTEMLPHYGYPDFPDGQLRTNVADYARFMELFLNEGEANGKQFLSKEAITEFLKVQYPQVKQHQAISWNYDEMDHGLYYRLIERLPAHTGGDPGVATIVTFDPDRKIAAIVFLNSPPVGFLDSKKFYLDIVKRLLSASLNEES